MKTLNYLLLAIGLWLLASCLTVGRIENNCDKFAKVCVTEQKVTVIVKDSFIYRIDTVIVTLPKDTVTLYDTITVINGLAQLPKVHKRSGVISVDAWVRNSVLSVYAYLNDSTILVPFRDTITIPVTTVTTDNTVLQPPVKYIPKFYKFTFWIFIVSLIAAVVYIAWSLFFKSRIEKFLR
jgi:hypothetical protein